MSFVLVVFLCVFVLVEELLFLVLWENEIVGGIGFIWSGIVCASGIILLCFWGQWTDDRILSTT